jgi:large subunit ribosomal protein L17
MRHNVFGRRLGRSSDQRVALRRNLLNQLFTHGRIKTTEAKAKAIKGEAEKIISIAKRGLKAGEQKAVHARRLTQSRLNNRATVEKLFAELAPRYAERPGGYTRILRVGQRLGDAASIVLLELVEE